MRLHGDWRKRLRYAWSMRFNAIGLALGGVSVFLQMIQPYSNHSPIVFAIGASLCAVGAGISTLISQPIFRDADKA